MSKEIRSDLQSMTLAWVEGMRRRRERTRYGGEHRNFLDELECVLRCQSDYPRRKWTKLEKDEVVLGEVWIQEIGEFHHKHTVHQFSLLYVETRGLAISEHSHYEIVNNGTQKKKVKEWYIWPNGRITFCNKDQMHELVNNYSGPIYVLSVKTMSNSDR